MSVETNGLSQVPGQSRMGFEELPNLVKESLGQIAREFAGKGVSLYLFGSFAEGRAWPTSDLDLAFTVESGGDFDGEISKAIEDLPTIRAIDLVALDRASSELREEVFRNGVLLSEK